MHEIRDGKHGVFDVGAHESTTVGEFVLLFGVVKSNVIITGDAGDEDFVSLRVDGENHVDVTEQFASVDATDEDIEGVFGEIKRFSEAGGLI